MGLLRAITIVADAFGRVLDLADVEEMRFKPPFGIARVTGDGAARLEISGSPASADADGTMSAADKVKLDALVPGGTGVASITPGTGIAVTGTISVPIVSATASSGAVSGTMSAANFTKLGTVGAGATVQQVQIQGALAFGVGSTTAIPIISIPAASSIVAGSMSAADKAKLDAVGAGATMVAVGVTAPITSTGGTSPTIGISAATTSAPGSFSGADKTKIDSLTAGAAVASVSGTAPIASSGGATPAISISAASHIAAGSQSAAHFDLLDGATAAPDADTIPKRGHDGEIAYSIVTAAGLVIGDAGSTFASAIALTPFADGYSASIGIRGRDGGKHQVTLTGAIAFEAPTVFGDGAGLKLRVIQGGSGLYGATWASPGAGGFSFPVGMSGTLIATAVGDADYFEFEHWTTPVSHWMCSVHVKYSPP